MSVGPVPGHRYAGAMLLIMALVHTYAGVTSLPTCPGQGTLSAAQGTVRMAFSCRTAGRSPDEDVCPYFHGRLMVLPVPARHTSAVLGHATTCHSAAPRCRTSSRCCAAVSVGDAITLGLLHCRNACQWHAIALKSNPILQSQQTTNLTVTWEVNNDMMAP